MPKRGAKAAFIEEAVAYLGNECLLWPYHRNWSGYGVIEFRGQRNYRVHRIICERVYGLPSPDLPVVAHSCGNPACLTPAHLRWTTQADNLHDMMRHGTLARGNRLPQTKLTADDVIAIRALSAEGLGAKRIAQRYGVRWENIRAIIRRQTWAWL